MYCVRTVTKDLYWVGANDHRLTLFENIHPIPKGVSYNAYLLLDKKSVLFDTVDWSACRQLLENLAYVLDGRELDYPLVNHLEPDHAACIEEILLRHPKAFLLCTGRFIGICCIFVTVVLRDSAALKLSCFFKAVGCTDDILLLKAVSDEL